MAVALLIKHSAKCKLCPLHQGFCDWVTRMGIRWVTAALFQLRRPPPDAGFALGPRSPEVLAAYLCCRAPDTQIIRDAEPLLAREAELRQLAGGHCLGPAGHERAPNGDVMPAIAGTVTDCSISLLALRCN